MPAVRARVEGGAVADYRISTSSPNARSELRGRMVDQSILGKVGLLLNIPIKKAVVFNSRWEMRDVRLFSLVKVFRKIGGLAPTKKKSSSTNLKLTTYITHW